MSSKKKNTDGSSKTPENLQLINALREEPWSYDFFAMARRFQNGHDGPGFGYSLRPREDPVRFGQHARMAIASRSIHSVESDGERQKILLLFSGLFGPNAPMPYYMTEVINDRRQHHNDDSISSFADIFHHRFFSLFYRAWADSDPVLSMDKGQGRKEDVFAKFMGAVGGTFLVDSEEFKDLGQRYYMGHIGPSSSRPEGLEKVLHDHTGADIAVKEFIGTWLELSDEDCLSLGGAKLGDGKILGNSVYSPASAFEIEVGPLSEETYDSFLPKGENAKLVREIVMTTIGLELKWRVRLLRDPKTITGTKLGQSNGGRLGYDVWMGAPDKSVVCDDLVLSHTRYGDLHKESGDMIFGDQDYG